MKKMVLAAIAVIATSGAFAQLKLGVQAIGNLSTANVRFEDDVDVTKKMKIMPGAGLVAQYNISDEIAVRTGLNYLKHGLKVKVKGNGEGEINTGLHYIQLPLNVLYSIPVGEMKVYAGIGGFLNYGLSGTVKQSITQSEDGEPAQTTVVLLDAFKKDSDPNGAGLKRADLGASAIVGIQFKSGLFVNAGYQLSITNISQGNGKYNNRGLQLTLGYFIK